MTMVLSETKVNRSAYAVKTAEVTTVYMGHCPRHDLPVREAKLGLEPELAPRVSRVLCFHDPADEHEILGEKLVAVTTSLDCDPGCKSARRNACSCGCGGSNHGLGWSRQYMIDHRELFESQVEAYRAEQIRLASQREARKAAREQAKCAAFEAWFATVADVVQFVVAQPDYSGFLGSMKSRLENEEILSDRMMEVVSKIKTEREERAWHQAEYARRDAERHTSGRGDQATLAPGVYQLGAEVFVVKGNRVYVSRRKSCREQRREPPPEGRPSIRQEARGVGG